MPRALAIETSGRIGSIALVEDGAVVSEQVFQHGLQHAAKIIPIIDELCRSHRVSPSQIDHLYISAGPGSFIVGQAARFYFQHGASWGDQSPKAVVTQILENTDKQSVLEQLKAEILKKLAVNRHADEPGQSWFGTNKK